MPERLAMRLRDGVRVHVEAYGDADAPLTVVLLHGWTLDRRTWYRQITGLRERIDAPIRTIVYDARGHGRSAPTSRDAATLAQLGDDLDHVLRTVAPDGPLVLAGHSLGGMTIMEYAYRHPQEFADRVVGMVLVSTTAEGASRTSYGLPERAARLIRVAETTGAGVLARAGGWRPHGVLLPALRPALRWLLFGSTYDPEDGRLITAAVSRASLNAIGGFRASIGVQQRLETLAALAPVPTTVLVGEWDKLTPPACSRAIVDAIPGARLILCPRAGHMLIMECPDEVSDALADIVQQVLTSR